MTESTEQRLFLVTMNINQPMIMCERHAASFGQMMTDLELPHQIVPLDDEPASTRCMVCELAELQTQGLQDLH